MPNQLNEPRAVPPPHVSLREYADSRLASLEKLVAERVDAAERATAAHFVAQEKAVGAALAAQQAAVAAALAAADRAVLKSELSSEKRFESVNEFRQSLDDQSRLLMPRGEAERALSSITEKVDVLTQRLNARDGRGVGRSDVWGWVVAGVGVISAVVGFLIRAATMT